MTGGAGNRLIRPAGDPLLGHSPQADRGLILFNTHAHFVREDDYPWGIPREDLDGRVAVLKETWGTAPCILRGGGVLRERWPRLFEASPKARSYKPQSEMTVF